MPHPSTFRRVNSPFQHSYKRVPGEGPSGPVRLMLIGERPGEEEARRGRPFCGISGKYLDICLTAAALDRKEIWITNLVKDFKSYGKPSKEELVRDHDELVQEILEHDPEVIGLVGGWAVEEVLRVNKAEMEKVHGVPSLVDKLFGEELKYGPLVSDRAAPLASVINIKSVDLPHVYIGRGSVYGNPFTHLALSETKAVFQVGTRQESIDCYAKWLDGDEGLVGRFPLLSEPVWRQRRQMILNDIPSLAGRLLGCYCKPAACHGDVLAEKAGYGAEGGRGWIIVPIMHPANCVYSPEVTASVLDDILTVAKILDGEIGVVNDRYAEEGATDYRLVTAEDLKGILPQ